MKSFFLPMPHSIDQGVEVMCEWIFLYIWDILLLGDPNFGGEKAVLRNFFNPHIYLDNCKLYSLIFEQKTKGLLYPSGLTLVFLWISQATLTPKSLENVGVYLIPLSLGRWPSRMLPQSLPPPDITSKVFQTYLQLCRTERQKTGSSLPSHIGKRENPIVNGPQEVSLIQGMRRRHSKRLTHSWVFA